MPNILDYANPTRFLNFARIVLPWLSGLTLILLVIGLYGAFTAPADYQQGETVRIMYIHVPSAWMSMFLYSVATGYALLYWIWRSPVSAVMMLAIYYPTIQVVPLSNTGTVIAPPPKAARCRKTGGGWGLVGRAGLEPATKGL